MASDSSSCTSNRYFCLAFHFVSFALLLAPMGLGWYVGNLAVYLNSYWYATQNPVRFYSHWILSVSIVSWSATMIIAGKLIRRLDHGTIILIGIIIFDTGIFCSYYAVQHSQIAFIATYGVTNGMGQGFIQMEIFARIPSLVPNKRLGMTFAMFNNFFVLGAACFQWFITWHINPRNMDADQLVLDYFKVFSEKSVLDHVPSVLLLLGIVTSISHWTGLLLSAMLLAKGKEQRVKEPNLDTIITATESTALTEPDTTYHTTSAASSAQQGPFKYIDLTEIVEEEEFGPKSAVPTSFKNKRLKISRTKSYNREMYSQTTEPQKTLPGKIRSPRPENSPSSSMQKKFTSESSEDLTQVQMLKTAMFYVVWLAFFAVEGSYVVLLNFYKSFGQLWIHDDYFLTRMGLVFLFFVFVVTIVFAALVDTYGTKTMHVLLNALMAVGFLLYYITPQVDRWLFAVWTSCMTGLYSAAYLTFPVMTLKLFGETHFMSNFGIVATSNVAVNIVAPPVLQLLMEHLGWAAIFITTGAVNFLSLIAVIVGLPNRY